MTPTQNDRNADAASLDLEAIKARATAATEGPWEWDDPTIGQHWSRPQPWATVVDDEVECGGYCYGGSSSPIKSDADGQFLAHAREDIPALVAEVERLRTLHKDRAALIRAVSAAQDAGDDAGIELTRSDLNPIVRAALSAALGGEQR